MSLDALLVFAAALFVAAAAPGPGIAALVARVLGRGTGGAVAFTTGLALGDVVWLAVAVAGLSALAQSFHTVFLVLKYAGAAYLLVLAWKLWTAPAAPAGSGEAPRPDPSWRLFLAGLAVTLGNPKVMVFYLALVPNLIDVASITPLGFAELAAVLLAVLAVVFGSYILLAARARRLLASPRAVRAVNRTTGAVMAGAAVAVATR
ncbi:LysE family translocator [Enterovirga aerilata]|uniref:LysE family translocator n=1 Tax=Enterovirga aerilata TaxID=2730920 RepID=A0A849I6E0_9HYPH|nr:LysE family translocator [Enterovirga sp. DB1703]NNM72881.1 LysE family translocator [Enterovirga sp. DB1703]